MLFGVCCWIAGLTLIWAVIHVTFCLPILLFVVLFLLICWEFVVLYWLLGFGLLFLALWVRVDFVAFWV